MVVISITYTTWQIASKTYLLGFCKDKNAKLHDFFAAPTIVKTAMEAFSVLIIHLFSRLFSQSSRLFSLFCLILTFM